MSSQPLSRALPAKTADITPGFYRHYKGTVYRVLGTGWHSDTDAELVVYHQADDATRLFARPVASFMEPVTIAEAPQARYAFISAKDFKGDTYAD